MEGEESPAPTRGEIIDAARALASAPDGEGYDGADFPAARAVLAFPSPTDRQIRCLWHLLRKYRPRLEIRGISYDSLVPPPMTAAGAAAMAPAPGVARRDLPARIRMMWAKSDKGRRCVAAIFECEAIARNPRFVAFRSVMRRMEHVYFDKEGGNSLGLKDAWMIPGDVERFDEALGGFEAIEPQIPIEVEPALRADMDRVREERRVRYRESRAESADLEVPTKLPLRPFQKAGVKWVDDLDGRAMIADEMGLGKTPQALGWLLLRQQKALPALVVCSAGLRPNWVIEARKFTDFKCLIISGKTSVKTFQRLGFDASETPLPGYDLTIINYNLFSADGVKSWIKLLQKTMPFFHPKCLRCGKEIGGTAALAEACPKADKEPGHEIPGKELRRIEDQEYAAESLVESGVEGLDAVEAEMKKKGHPLQLMNHFNRVLEKIRAKGDEARKGRGRYYKYYVNGMPLDRFAKSGAFKTLVSDEMHYIQDWTAQRTKAVMALSRKVKNSLGLTGTPIQNRPKDAWSQLYVVNPRIFPVFLDYGKKFCGAYHTGYGWDFSGASNLDELDKKLRESVMIRRLKKDVLKELPEKIRITTVIEIGDGLKKYEKEAKSPLEKLAKLKKERDDWRAEVGGLDPEERKKFLAKHAERAARATRMSGAMLDHLEEVKRTAVAAKFDECVRFILNVQRQQGKVLVFMVHHEFTDRMQTALAAEGLKVDHIDGRIDGPLREPIKNRFQEGDLDVLICGIRAASEGLTLTASHTVVFVEFDWNPGRHYQAEDRVHRIGQTMTATIYYLVALGTIEERIAALIDGKREIINVALGEGDRTMDEKGILDTVLDDILEAKAA